jgi:hypothetical protein
MARGGRAGGWRLDGGWPRRCGRVRRARGVGSRATAAAPRTERMRKNVSAATGTLSRRGCRAPRGSSPWKGRAPRGPRATKGQERAAVITGVRARQCLRLQPATALVSTASAAETDGGVFRRRHERRQQGGREEGRNALPCRPCGTGCGHIRGCATCP